MRAKARKGLVGLSLPLILLACLAASGCDMLDPTYYTRPDSPGYTKPVFENTCPVCNEPFKYSQDEWDRGEAYKCPLHRKTSLFNKQKQENEQVTRDLKNLQQQHKSEYQAMKAQNDAELQRLRDEQRRTRQ